MSIAAIFNAVSLEVSAQLAAQDWGSTRRPELALPAMLFGPAGKTSKGAAPSIAWVFGTERFEDGPKPYIPRSQAGDDPRFLMTGWQTFVVHLWAPTNFIGPVSSQGSGQGALSFTIGGQPLTQLLQSLIPPTLPAGQTFAITYVQILTPGAVGVATFQYSLDQGVTFTGPVTTGMNVPLGTTGVSVTFSTPGSANPAFATGDLFQFVINASPLSDYDTAEEFVNAFISSLQSQLSKGAYRLSGGEWSGQDGSELTQMGKEYVLTMEVATPVTRVGSAPPGRAKVTNVDQLDILGSTTTHP